MVMIDKSEILRECMESKNGSIVVERNFKKRFEGPYAELMSFEYPEGFTFKQKLYHYLHNDLAFEIGLCKRCGKRCAFKGFRDGYYDYCCNQCAQLSSETRDKIKNTCIQKYGTEAYSQTSRWKNSVQTSWIDKDVEEITKKRKATKLERYGDENYSNNEKKRKTRQSRTEEEKLQTVLKTRQTKLERYGDEFYTNKDAIRETWNKKTKEEIREIVLKTKTTKLERYGDSGFNGMEKTKQTCLKKYGCTNPSSSDAVKKKREQTFLKKYGVPCSLMAESVKKKFAETRHKTEISKKDFLVGYTDDGKWICKCENPSCNMCSEKTYVTNCSCYDDRKTHGYETCTILNPMGVQTSGRELELLDYIKGVYNGEIVESDRKVLNGKELDVYLPELKTAFEFNGIYWHGEMFKDKNYHYEKTAKCAEKGIQLIHIWEDDWIYKKDAVKNLIRGKLGVQENKINARDCLVKELDMRTAKDFCETYHLQGYTNAPIKLGLYKDDKLVMVALFGQGRTISGGGKKEGEWELYRMCSLFDTLVRGGASKLVKHFTNLVHPKTIYTFADLCVSNGKLYEKIGFEKLYVVEPTYFWCIGDKRYPRYRFQKSNLVECKENPSLTENEVMRKRGYHKCWDAGKIKYIMNL